MSYITWIIIVLIVISIMVTVTEVAIRFGMLSKAKGPVANPALAVPVLGGEGEGVSGGTPLPPSDLEILAQTLGLQANASFDQVRQGIWALREENLLDTPQRHEDI